MKIELYKSSGFISFIAYIQKGTKTMKWLVRKSFTKKVKALGLRPQKNTTYRFFPNRGSELYKKKQKVTKVSNLSEIPSPKAKIISKCVVLLRKQNIVIT